MPTSLPTAIASRLEKAAVDNGFDRELPTVGEWLAFASTQCPFSIWLGMTSGGAFAIALSQHNVAVALGTMGEPFGETLPTGAVGARVVPDIPTLHHLIRRAFQLSKTLPDELLHLFVARTAKLPRTTEAERLVIQRIGQDIFRQGLLDYWEGRCAITGLAVPELLRASHIKPWAACETDAERLDVYNGLLLAPHLDAAFDQGFITVSDTGEVVVSPALDVDARQVLGLEAPTSVRARLDGHRAYLQWHWERVFRSGLAPKSIEDGGKNAGFAKAEANQCPS
jgi:putative restriction endonuclease